MVLYMLGNNNGAYGMELALKDPEAIMVLIQDATFLPLKYTRQLGETPKKIVAVHEHVERRGLLGRIPEYIRLIRSDELFDLMTQYNVVCFT